MQKKKKNADKKIGLIIFWYSLGISPGLINLVISCAGAGYKVHIFIDKASFDCAKIQFNNPKIVIHRITNIPVPESAKKNIIRNILYYIKVIFGFIKYYHKVAHLIGEDFSFIIGADVFGIIAAALVGTKKKIPLIYYNLELLLSRECQTWKEKSIKFFERRASQRAIYTIIQDKKRAQYLVRDNKLNQNRFIYIPTSTDNKSYKKNNFLRKKFNIAKDKIIIIYAGEIASWSNCLEICQSAQNWNEDFVLVIHASRIHKGITNYFNEVKKLFLPGKIYFSYPVEWQHLPQILASADIGLAFYKNTKQSHIEIGLSSGKMASYLQAGLPVITIDFPSLHKIIDQYKIGKYTNNIDQIEKLAREILKDFDFYRQNVKKCFKEKYNFANYFPLFLKKIEKL